MKMKYFELAKALSTKSSYHHKIGAVVVKKNRVLGVGFNKPEKTHPKSTNEFNTIHAELDAIIGVDDADLEGADIYVYREHANGKPAMSKPCPGCHELIKRVGISNIYYTTYGDHSSECLDED